MTEPRTKPDFTALWHAFIDSYTHSIDIAPPCRRHLFIERDIHALWADFIRTQMDFAEAHETITAHPDRYLKGARQYPLQQRSDGDDGRK